MATTKQENALKIKVENPKKNMGNIMLEAGYAKETARKPKLLTNSKGWQELLSKVDDVLLVDKLYQIALDKQDKRSCMDAIKEIFKLKDKYPSTKYKEEGLGEEIRRLLF